MSGRCAVMRALRAALVLGAAAVPIAVAGATAGTVRGQPAATAARSVDRLVLDKSDHRLEAWSRGQRVGTYRVAIGSGGLGPKRREGDDRTPEGRYTIDSRHRSRAFHRFLHVSYPNRDDRRAFRRLVADGTFPRTARIGGAIGIHGTGPSPATAAAHGLGLDWTAGCIAVTNAEIETLYTTVRPHTPLEIRR